jgi:hypothetical protein
MAKVQLNFEFDVHEEQEEFQIQAKAREMHAMLTHLDAAMRQAYKHNEKCNANCDLLIEGWREIISEVGVL